MIRSSAAVDIPTAETPQDQALSKAVLDRLLADKKADLIGISVGIKRPKSIPERTVKSLDARQQAVKIAWETPGVQSVVNSLQAEK